MDNNEKNQTNEEYYAVVVWKDNENKAHIVGTLAYFDSKYYFKYEQASLRNARDKGFIDVASFNDDEKLYISENTLFSYFKMRVSNAVKKMPTAMAELIETRGRSTNDDISVLPFPERYKPAIKAEIRRIELDQNEAEQVQVCQGAPR